MGQEQKASPAARAGNPSHEVRPLRHARIQLAQHAERLQVVAQQLSRGGLVPRRVDRVDPDQLLEKGRHLLAERGDGH